MIAKDLISTSIMHVKPENTYIEALSWMDEFKLTQLPVVDGMEYAGLLTESDIYSSNRFEEALNTETLSLPRIYVDEYRHIFDVLRMFGEHQLSLLPVLDSKNHYLGVITLEDLLQKFSSIASLHNPGGVIVLERNYKDYSLSEIAQIVESNDATILSLFITSNPESTMMEISIKINRMDLAPVLQTFNRYNYTIKATFGESSHLEELKDRYDQLMTYLNI